MADIELRWGGTDPEDLADDLDALDAAVKEHVLEAVETWALMVESTAKELAPVDTGQLRASINSEARRVGENLLKAFIGSNVPHAPYIEEGRGPITASGDGVLHFTIDGEEIFAKSVSAAEAQPFLEPAVTAHLSDLRDLLDEALTDAVAEVRAS